MDLILLSDGVYHLVEVTKEMMKGIELLSEVENEITGAGVTGSGVDPPPPPPPQEVKINTENRRYDLNLDIVRLF